MLEQDFLKEEIFNPRNTVLSTGAIMTGRLSVNATSAYSDMSSRTHSHTLHTRASDRDSIPHVRPIEVLN